MPRPLQVLLLAVLTGCSFSRTVVNGHVREMDTSWIVPGVTTRDEIVNRIGRPPSVHGVGDRGGEGDELSRFHKEGLSLRPRGMDEQGEDVDGPEMRAFRWFSTDSFNGTFEGGHWIIPTFSKGHAKRAHDILILFDDRAVVRLLSRTESVDGKVRILEWKEAK